MARIFAVSAILAVLACDSALSADAIGKPRADAIAIVASGARKGTRDVVLFGLPRPLAEGTNVASADPVPGRLGKPARKDALTLRRAAWLYWLDGDPYARFSHASLVLLVDAVTGQVTRRELEWFPLVNGRAPVFLATRAGYDAARYRVFARTKPIRVSRSAGASAPGSWAATTLPRLLADDCVLMIGDYHSHQMAGDFPAVQRWASSVGVRAYYATRTGPRGSSPPPSATPPDGDVLAANVRTLVTVDRCTDVLIYLSGHGAREGKGPPTVFTGKTVVGADGAEPVVTHEAVTAGDLAAVMREHPTTGFKVKVDSCYSGRFVEALTDPRLPKLENLLIVEASSKATQPSYSALDAKRRADNPDRIGEFTNGNLVGLRTWAASPEEVASSVALGGSLLARALERSLALGRSANRSIAARRVEPVVWINPSPPLDKLTLSHWHPPGSSVSYFCGTLTGRPGVAGTFSATGPGGFAFKAPFDVAPDGRRSFNSRITRAGPYEVSASGGGVTLVREYAVPSPSGAAKGPIDCSLFPRP
jgi:hypothetical protein